MQEGVMTEADTCREFITPKLVEAGWGDSPYAIGEQRTFTNGRIIEIDYGITTPSTIIDRTTLAFSIKHQGHE